MNVFLNPIMNRVPFKTGHRNKHCFD